MILNSYAVLTIFLALWRLTLGVVVLACGAFGWQRWHGNVERRENAGHLALLLAVTLVLLAVASWPLLYLLLQSYVPEWPGAMCIYGVTQVGKGSSGPARHLPSLIFAMQLLKPALIFVGGAWYVIYLLDRRTVNAALLGRVFALLLPLGGLAIADSIADLTYVSIPKKEEFPAAGCCTTVASSSAERFMPSSWVGERGRGFLYGAYFGTTITVLMMLAAGVGGTMPGLTCCAAALNLGASAVFLVDIFAPTVLNLPFHHCAYDLIPAAPEGAIAAALHLAGAFALGWGVVLRRVGLTDETRPLVFQLLGDLSGLSLWCYATSLLMVVVSLVLA